MISNWIYFAKNSLENIAFAKTLNIENGSYVFYDEDLSKIDHDLYKDLEDVIFIENCDDYEFKVYLYKYIKEKIFSPEFIIVKDENLTDLWAIASLVNENLVDCNCFSIFEKMTIPLSEGELIILDCFEKNFILNPSDKDVEFLEEMGKIDDDDVKNILKKIVRLEDFYGENQEPNKEEGFVRLKEGILSSFENKVVDSCEI
jgi:hypothetical protein